MDERADLWTENFLVWELYNKWIELCMFNSGSMGNVYDFNALEFILNNYNLEQNDRGEIIDKIGAISTAIQEMNEEIKQRHDTFQEKFKNQQRVTRQDRRGK